MMIAGFSCVNPATARPPIASSATARRGRLDLGNQQSRHQAYLLGLGDRYHALDGSRDGELHCGQALTLADAQAALRHEFFVWLDSLQPGVWGRNRDYKKR
jgi:hypothetical protein